MIFAQQWIKHSQEYKITVNQPREDGTYQVRGLEFQLEVDELARNERLAGSSVIGTYQTSDNISPSSTVYTV